MLDCEPWATYLFDDRGPVVVLQAHADLSALREHDCICIVFLESLVQVIRQHLLVLVTVFAHHLPYFPGDVVERHQHTDRLCSTTRKRKLPGSHCYRRPMRQGGLHSLRQGETLCAAYPGFSRFGAQETACTHIHTRIYMYVDIYTYIYI